jgi:hypothetical protein
LRCAALAVFARKMMWIICCKWLVLKGHGRTIEHRRMMHMPSAYHAARRTQLGQNASPSITRWGNCPVLNSTDGLWLWMATRHGRIRSSVDALNRSRAPSISGYTTNQTARR